MSFAEIDNVLDEVAAERLLQNEKWGVQNHPLGCSRTAYEKSAMQWKASNEARDAAGETTWAGVLMEEVYEALAETNVERCREELIQVAAVAVAMVECIDRRGSAKGSGSAKG